MGNHPLMLFRSYAVIANTGSADSDCELPIISASAGLPVYVHYIEDRSWKINSS